MKKLNISAVLTVQNLKRISSTLLRLSFLAFILAALIVPQKASAASAAPASTPIPVRLGLRNRPPVDNLPAHPAGLVAKKGNNGIFYHGGPLILNTTNVYYIWYGNWSYDTLASSILTNLAQSIGGSPYFNINTTYYDGTNTHVTNAVSYGGSTTDNYSQGTSISDAGVQAIVASAISSGRLPSDTNAVYFVLTSKDVNETSGFGTTYCGWHTWGTINGANIKYSFVGDPSAINPAGCEEQTITSPNGDPGADGMASVIAHELEEAVTDPNLNAWYDRRGYENADKCAWTFGTTYTVSNGSMANMVLGGSNYLIQRNWVNASGGYCSLSY